MPKDFPLPEPFGWCLEMHGVCVAFASNAEKTNGQLPSFSTPMFTEAQVRATLEAYSRSQGANVSALLEALQEMVECFGPNAWGSEQTRDSAWERARAAISLATGALREGEGNV